jgi:hypothetical protein
LQGQKLLKEEPERVKEPEQRDWQAAAYAASASVAAALERLLAFRSGHPRIAKPPSATRKP